MLIFLITELTSLGADRLGRQEFGLQCGTGRRRVSRVWGTRVIPEPGHAPWLTEGETIGHLTTEFLSRHLPHARSGVCTGGYDRPSV